MELTELLRVAEAAVDRGRKVAESRAPGVLTSKGDRDMASEVDFAVERAIREFLEAETPQLGILGEEEGGAVDGPRWALDPIDGTVNFVHGLPLWAISLGLIVEERSVLGVIDLPALGNRYAAVAGAGATCDGKPIQAGSAGTLADALVALGDYAVGLESEARNVPRHRLAEELAPRVQRMRVIGTAATDLCWSAHGYFDATVMFSNKPWDTAAGVVIAREAGNLVLDLDGSEHTPASVGTVAVVPALADELVELLRRSGY